MSIRDTYLPLLDRYRGMLDTVWGLRRYDVLVRVKTWSGIPGSPGSTPTVVDTPLTVGGGARVNVEQVSERAVIASGGLYQDQDLRVGPFTPTFTGGGVDPSTLDPGGTNIEVFFQVSGPGLATAWYKKIGQEIVRANFHYVIILRKTAESP